MLAISRSRPALFLALCGASLIGACRSSEAEWNSLRRTRAEVARQEAETANTALERELLRIEQQRAELEAERAQALRGLAVVRRDSAQRAAQLQAALSTLQAMEEDLGAAQERSQAIEQELAPLRAQQAERQQLEQKLNEGQARVEALREEVAAKQAEFTAQEQAARAERDRLAQELERVAVVLTQLRAALEAADGLGVAPPAADAAPATPAEKKPAEKKQ